MKFLATTYKPLFPPLYISSIGLTRARLTSLPLLFLAGQGHREQDGAVAALQAPIGPVLPRRLRPAASREGPLLRNRLARLPLAGAQVRQDRVARPKVVGGR